MKTRTFAVAATALTAAALTLAPAATADTLPVPAITPGAGIGAYNAAGQHDATCTLGFLATGADGARYAFTAGHCASDGNVVMRYQAADNFKDIGQFAESTLVEGGLDIAVIRLDPADLPLDTRIFDRRPVTGVTDQVVAGDELCFFGYKTGDKKCGKVGLGPQELGEPRVTFGAVSQHGDSGGPVYRIEKDGTATAIGVLDEGNDRYSTATLIQPYLQKWGLTIDTTPRPNTPAQPIGYQPR